MQTRIDDRYPTRQSPEPVWQDRTVPVLYPGDQSHPPLSAEQASQFERDGFLVLPRIYSAEEVEVFRKEVERLGADPTICASEKTIREPGSETVRSVFAIHRDNPLFSRVASDERVAGVARFLLGGDVYIHQSRLNFKPGFTGKRVLLVRKIGHPRVDGPVRKIRWFEGLRKIAPDGSEGARSARVRQ